MLRQIVAGRMLAPDQREKYGGLGPMTPDSLSTDKFCAKVRP